MEKSITNHEIVLNNFQHIKNLKKHCKPIGQIHFCLHHEKEVLKCFWQNHKSNYDASFNTQKSIH